MTYKLDVILAEIQHADHIFSAFCQGTPLWMRSEHFTRLLQDAAS